MKKIDTANSGIEAARRRWNEYHPLPAKPNAWDKLADTLQTTTFDVNALIDEVVSLRDDLNTANNRINTLNSRVTTLENMPPFPQ